MGVAAHRLSHQVNAIFVDVEFLAHHGKHIHYILLAVFAHARWRGAFGFQQSVPSVIVVTHRGSNYVAATLGGAGSVPQN
jgi:hypothetical protein